MSYVLVVAVTASCPLSIRLVICHPHLVCPVHHQLPHILLVDLMLLAQFPIFQIIPWPWQMNATQQQGEREERKQEREDKTAQEHIERDERRRERAERAAEQHLLVGARNAAYTD